MSIQSGLPTKADKVLTVVLACFLKQISIYILSIYILSVLSVFSNCSLGTEVNPSSPFALTTVIMSSGDC